MINVHLELCYLGTHISSYPTISQGKTRIPGVNDGEEFELVDVSHKPTDLILDRTPIQMVFFV